MKKENHVVWHNGRISRQDRCRLNRHLSGVLWFTGLPGSGKSTLAHELEKELFERGSRAYVLDGDNIRHGLNADLGFNREDRRENLRRVVEVSKLFADAGIIVISALISPFIEDREYARAKLHHDAFYEIYIKCAVEECMQRNSKGHYEKARQGLIKDYTGISAPYEVPPNPDLIIDTQALTLEMSTQKILSFLKRKGFLKQQISHAPVSGS